MIARTIFIFDSCQMSVDDTVYMRLMIDGVVRFHKAFDNSSYGVLIARYESDCGRMFDLRLDGDAVVVTQNNVLIKDISYYEQHVKRHLCYLLEYRQLPILRLIEVSPETEDPIETGFHGVYYRVSDAENYLISQFRNMVFSDIGSPSM